MNDYLNNDKSNNIIVYESLKVDQHISHIPYK